MAKPIVDGLERKLEDRAQVVRHTIFSKPGRKLAAEHGVTALPALLIFDGDGQLIGRQVGLPDPGSIEATLGEV